MPNQMQTIANGAAARRRICGPATATYSGIVAKTRGIWIADGHLECEIAAAGSSDSLPSKHDRIHASVTSLVFLMQPRFRQLECRFATLSYSDGVRRRITVSLTEASEMLSQLSGGNSQLELTLPAPLVGFLCASRVTQRD